jgi:amino acid transporter
VNTPLPEGGGHKQTTLKRSLTLPLVVLYGLGTTVGAGIYVLIGKVAGFAGFLTPLAFLVAAAIMAFTVFSFAELSARFPESAGEAVYVYQGFRRRLLSVVVGLSVAFMGIVSSGAIIHGFIGYLGEFLEAPPHWEIIAVVAFLTAVAAWGISESVAVAATATIIEVGGLLLVIGGAMTRLPEASIDWSGFFVAGDTAAWSGVFAGALLAFYAFIGFEDMVNVAEEVKDVRRVLPKAIIITLIITTVLYVALAMVAVAVVPPQTLAASDAPLALLFQRSTGMSPVLVTAIAMVAVLNGALIQIIMAARVFFGLSKQGWLPSFLGRIHRTRRTPVNATVLVGLAVLAFTLLLPIVTLARITSLAMLAVFVLINLALWRIKVRDRDNVAAPCYPLWVPVLGCIASLCFLAGQLYMLLS